MSRGRHREEPARRPLLRLSLPRLPRRLPHWAVAAGVGVALLGVVSLVTIGLNVASRPAAAPQATDDGIGYSALAGDALQDAAALRAEGRASRDRSRTAVTPTTATTPVTATPAPQPKPVPKVVGKLWVATAVNVRSGPSADLARVGRLTALTQVGVTGVTKSGWTQVVVDGKAGWVRSTFLSKTKPKPQASSAPAGVSNAPCPKSSSIEAHLTANARAVYRAVCAAYGSSVSSFGGYRAGDPGDHGSGRAVDIMVSGDPGTRIARYVQAHAKELNVTYVIYQQRIWMAGNPTSQWKLMEDRGSTTANHYDHVHVSVE